jgi:hypothetical protein
MSLKNILRRYNAFLALSILNSLLIFVFVLFLIEKLDFLYLLRFNFIFISLIIGSLKVYVMSGVSGCIIEILSGEEIVLQFRRIHQNAKDLWPGFLITYVLISFLDFSLFIFVPSFRIWRPLFFSMTGIAATIVLAQWTVNKKYIGPLGIARGHINFDLNFLIVLIAAFLLELALSGPIQSGNFLWRNVLTLMLGYIHVFEFIFCSLYILDGYPEIKEKFRGQKEIFLINPMGPGILQSLATWFMRFHPPAFVVLKALSSKTYKFREFSRVIWQDRYYKNNVLVCITCFTSNSCEAYTIAKEFKKRGAKVVMGGPHVTYLPNEALAFCDSVVIGQAEGVWRDLVRDYENGTLKPRYMGNATEADYAQVHEELLASPHVDVNFDATFARSRPYPVDSCGPSLLTILLR